jgi:hypothetical protein
MTKEQLRLPGWWSRLTCRLGCSRRKRPSLPQVGPGLESLVANIAAELLGDQFKVEVYQEATRVAAQGRPRPEEKERSIMTLFLKTLDKLDSSAGPSARPHVPGQQTFFH